MRVIAPKYHIVSPELYKPFYGWELIGSVLDNTVDVICFKPDSQLAVFWRRQDVLLKQYSNTAVDGAWITRSQTEFKDAAWSSSFAKLHSQWQNESGKALRLAVWVLCQQPKYRHLVPLVPYDY